MAEADMAAEAAEAAIGAAEAEAAIGAAEAATGVAANGEEEAMGMAVIGTIMDMGTGMEMVGMAVGATPIPPTIIMAILIVTIIITTTPTSPTLTLTTTIITQLISSNEHPLL
jgi:hypothetical protein